MPYIMRSILSALKRAFRILRTVVIIVFHLVRVAVIKTRRVSPSATFRVASARARRRTSRSPPISSSSTLLLLFGLLVVSRMFSLAKPPTYPEGLAHQGTLRRSRKFRLKIPFFSRSDQGVAPEDLDWGDNDDNPYAAHIRVPSKRRRDIAPARTTSTAAEGKLHHAYRLDGLMEFVPNGPHPVYELIRVSEKKWKDKLGRASRTLKDAVEEYRRRYQRMPPKGFDKWCVPPLSKVHKILFKGDPGGDMSSDIRFSFPTSTTEFTTTSNHSGECRHLFCKNNNVIGRRMAKLGLSPSPARTMKCFSRVTA